MRTDRWTDAQTDRNMTKVTVAFRSFPNAQKKKRIVQYTDIRGFIRILKIL